MHRWLLLMYLMLLAGTGCGGATTNQPAAKPAEVSSAPTGDASAADVRLSIVSFDEIQQRIAAQRGKVVVMDAWSTSCVPCLKEFHNLVELSRQYPPEKLACISLSFDFEGGRTKPEDQVDRVLGFLKEQGATFENLMSNEESDVLYRKFNLAAIPAVFVYDPSGQLRKRFDNEKARTKEEAFSYEQVKQLVAELIAEGEQAAPSETPSEK